MADPDLQISWGGGRPQKMFVRPFRPHFGLKIRGEGTRAPRVPPSLLSSDDMSSVKVDMLSGISSSIVLSSPISFTPISVALFITSLMSKKPFVFVSYSGGPTF